MACPQEGKRSAQAWPAALPAPRAAHQCGGIYLCKVLPEDLMHKGPCGHLADGPCSPVRVPKKMMVLQETSPTTERGAAILQPAFPEVPGCPEVLGSALPVEDQHCSSKALLPSQLPAPFPCPEVPVPHVMFSLGIAK